MMLVLGILFLSFNIPLFRRAILGEVDDDQPEIGAGHFIPWLVILAIFPAITYGVGTYFADKNWIVDVMLQAFVAVCWLPIVKIFLVGRRAVNRSFNDGPPPLIRVFTFFMLLLFGGLIGNAVWLLLRISNASG
jgi:hypothetical protein